MARFSTYTWIGPRPRNEDYVRVEKIGNDFLGCIADGVGGIQFGNIASFYSVSKFFEYLTSYKITDLKSVIERIHNELIEKGKELDKAGSVAMTRG